MERMKRFIVEVGRDARVHYSAEIEAEDLSSIVAKCFKTGVAGEDDWDKIFVEEFDSVETYTISVEDDEGFV
jgi:hypothetical protein